MSEVYTAHRVEPICREGDPGRGLAAPVHDPLWMLARQRQFGELAGEDTGSPVIVQLKRQWAAIDGWRPAGSDEEFDAFDAHSNLLEAVVFGETPGPNISVRDQIEAGRRLAWHVGDTIAQAIQAKVAITVPQGWSSPLRHAPRRVADGIKVAKILLKRPRPTDAELATSLGLSATEFNSSRDALGEFERWCATQFGLTPPTWKADRLERRFELGADGKTVLRAPAHVRETLDTPDLDLAFGGDDPPETLGDNDWLLRVPAATRFPGMPNDRFWEFEDANLSLARIDAATHDLARLALVEFSTIYGNDWFNFPLPIAFGSMMRVPEIVVRDTFGRHQLITPAKDANWAIFTAATDATDDQWLVIPPVTTGSLAGPIIEEVAFVRDENANLAWGIERIVTDDDGDVRDLQAEYRVRERAAATMPSDADLLYLLMTEVPDFWVPFIPAQLPRPDGEPESVPRRIRLVEAVLPRPDSFGEPVIVEPRSSVLRELQGVPLFEEEVPSAGVIVRRRWYLARSPDGTRHAWAARSTSAGRGEGSSGLQFDVALDPKVV